MKKLSVKEVEPKEVSDNFRAELLELIFGIVGLISFFIGFLYLLPTCTKSITVHGFDNIYRSRADICLEQKPSLFVLLGVK